MADMLGVIFYEQRSMATQIGFIEVPIYWFDKLTADRRNPPQKPYRLLASNSAIASYK